MAHTRVDSAAVRIQAADDHVVDADKGGENAHRGDEPERGITADGKGKADDVGFARAPIAVKNRSRAGYIDIARTLNVGWYQFFDSNEAASRDEALHFCWSRSPTSSFAL